jgi:polyisoprenoid-binding protein YceI
MSATTLKSATIPGYVAGTWTIDPVHSDASFTVRHMMVSKVRGHFGSFSGTIVTAENPLESSASASIDLASIDTNNAQRDEHIRSADFLDVEKHATMTWASAGLRQVGDGWVADGHLTLRDVTRPVPLTLELNGVGPDAYGGTRIGFSATGEISRGDFGVTFNAALPDGGGVVVGDKITIHLEVEGVLDTPSA